VPDGSVVQAGACRSDEAVRRFDHGVVSHPVEQVHGGVGSGGAQRVHHGGDGDRVVEAPHNVQRCRIGLYGAGEPGLVARRSSM
jgi:hypothetical protein